jgi:hypothetical protein
VVKVTDMTMIGSFSLVFSGHIIGYRADREPIFKPDTRFFLSRQNHPGRFFHNSSLQIREFLELLEELDDANTWITTREYSSPPVHEDHPDASEAPPHVAMMACIHYHHLNPDEQKALAAKIFKEVYDNDPWGKPLQLETEEFYYWRWHMAHS